MAGLDPSYLAFSAALQRRLGVELSERPLAEGVWLLDADQLPLRIAYYTLSPFRKRVPMAGRVRCIHVDEDTWVTRPVLLLNRIAVLLGTAKRVYARDTVASRIDKSAALSFQEAHHLQVPLPGKYRFGLFYRGELVAIAVFSGGRKMRDKPNEYRSFELLRFCHEQHVHVVGGFSKLLTAFQRAFQPGDIMTYADKDWSDGNSYEKTGFEKKTETEPQLFWVDVHTMTRYYALPTDLSGTPGENWQKSGYLPVYNSGSIKFVKTYLTIR